MAGERRRRSLGELIENFDGRRVPVKESDRRPGAYPYYGASGIVDWVDGYLFDGEYLLIAEDGENLRTRRTPAAFLAQGKFWVNNHAHIVRGNDEADTRYLMYALQAADISGYLTGSTIPKLTQGSMNRILIPSPDLPEQRAIANILSALDDKIQANGRMNKTLEATVQAIFKSCFVDADLEGIKTAWKEGQIEEIVSLGRSTLNPGDFPEEQFGHYSLPAFDERRLPILEKGEAIKSNKFIVPPNSILLSRLNPRIPRVWLPCVTESHRSVCSTEFMVALPRDGVPREWLYCFLNSAEFLENFATFVTGTSGSHQRVKPESLLAMPVHIPPKPMMERFAGVASPIYARIARNLEESQVMAETRDAMLPKLISGELRVGEAAEAAA